MLQIHGDLELHNYDFYFVLAKRSNSKIILVGNIKVNIKSTFLRI